ncbi:MAG: autotransporter, partial [Sphingobacteriales bacterium]
MIIEGGGATVPATLGNISFADSNTSGSAGIAVTGMLTTSATGKVKLDVPTGLLWATGSTYNLISFGSFTGAISHFEAGNIVGLGARQTPTPVLNGSNIALMINGDTPVWTGVASGAWSTAAVGSPFNWKLQVGGGGTEFLLNDQAVFDDNATGTTNVVINDATVAPASVTFNNSAKEYTVSGTGGISAGLLVKNGAASVQVNTSNTYTGGTAVNAGTLTLAGNNNFGTGTLTVNGGTAKLSGANTYTGATTVNAGALHVNNAGALGASVLTLNGGTLDNSSGAAVTLATATAQRWNGDFTFAGTNNLNFNNGPVTLGGTLGQRAVNVAGGTLSTGLITGGEG